MLHSLIPASIFFALIVLAGGAIVTVVQALKAGARREEASIVQEPVAASRFTIPVSILLPVDSNQDALPQTVRMLLGLAYPEFEVIVVAGRLEGDVLDRLSTEWGLAAKEFFYRHSIETEPVNRIYRAGVDSRLTVVDKAGAGRADALNCGVDLARYRYVCTIPDDVEVETDGLLRVMSPALWDPAQVLAVSSHIERAPCGRYRSPTADASAGQAGAEAPRPRLSARLTAPYQYLGSIRSLMDSRLLWQGLRGGLGPTEHVIVWRRDALVQLGGFSKTAADPSLDMMVRLQSAGPERMPGHVVRSAEVFGHAPPAPLGEIIRRAKERQRAAAETIVETSRARSSVAPNVRRQEGKIVAYFLTSELIAPLLQGWAVAAMVLGALIGWFSWYQVVLLLVFLSFGNAIVSSAALFLRAAAPGAPEGRDLNRLLVTSPLEFILYRPALAYARVTALGSAIARLVSD